MFVDFNPFHKPNSYLCFLHYLSHEEYDRQTYQFIDVTNVVTKHSMPSFDTWQFPKSIDCISNPTNWRKRIFLLVTSLLCITKMQPFLIIYIYTLSVFVREKHLVKWVKNRLHCAAGRMKVFQDFGNVLKIGIEVSLFFCFFLRKTVAHICHFEVLNVKTPTTTRKTQIYSGCVDRFQGCNNQF